MNAPRNTPRKFRSVLDFHAYKSREQKISMVTCYDAAFAQLIAKTDVDTILVGDSLAMAVYGRPNTLGASVAEMARHIEAVRRGAPDKFIVGDLPFLSYRSGLPAAMDAVRQLLVAGATALKLEGGRENAELITHLVKSGVPVLGHLGLTPQHVHQLGGFRVQGRGACAAETLIEDAHILQTAGCCAIVLECIPFELAAKVTQALHIPTIGIGAGSAVDGQVLVLYDLLGLSGGFAPRFVKRYMDGESLITQALAQFHTAVVDSSFPSAEHSYE